tara:strand:+ start:772 stop:1104 length:333 start_codon:yes stop_codon:yes gene_type:complete
MKVEVNTDSKNVLYLQGEYPVGHITRVMEYYVRQSETFDRLFENMKNRIKDLEAIEGHDDYRTIIIDELKDQLKAVDCWWEPAMEGESYQQECDMQLRHFKGQRLGSNGL